MVKIIKQKMIFIINILVVFFMLASFFLFTPLGSGLIAKGLIPIFIKAENIEFHQASGNIMTKLILNNVRINGMRWLPRNSTVIANRIEIWFTKFSKEGVNILISEGSIISPKLGGIVFSGEARADSLDILIKSRQLNLREIPQLSSKINLPKNFSGNLSHLEIKITGQMREPNITGVFTADNVVYGNYFITNLSCDLNAVVRFSKEKISMRAQTAIKDISISSMSFPGIQANIQKTDVGFDTDDIGSISVKIFHGRLSALDSDAIIFSGGYKGGFLDFNIYAKRINTGSFIGLFNQQITLIPVTGDLADADFYVKGYLKELSVKGTFFIKELNRGQFSLRESAVTTDLNLKNIVESPKIKGSVIINNGVVYFPSKTMIYLEEGKFLFLADPRKPSFDIKGNSDVDRVKIKIILKGTFDKPDIHLSSDPNLPQEQLLVMLITGKGWKGVDTAFNKGAIPPDLAMDFIDYFVLGGGGAKLADRFGITGFSVTADKTTKGIEIKKSVSSKAEVGYSVLETQNEGKTSATTQKISGELKVTETISLSGEKEFKQNGSLEKSAQEQKTDEKVMIKFKKSF